VQATEHKDPSTDVQVGRLRFSTSTPTVKDTPILALRGLDDIGAFGYLTAGAYRSAGTGTGSLSACEYEVFYMDLFA
jgi:hypothetical protein